MKIKTSIGLWIAFLAVCFSSGLHAQTSAPKKSKIPAALKADAKIPVEQARATAVKRVPGEIQEEELEKENGKLVYSFDIKATGQKDITEVQVDAVMVRLLATRGTSPRRKNKVRPRQSPDYDTAAIKAS